MITHRILMAIETEALKTRALLCDRCHSLLHHENAESIESPSVAAIKEMIVESPHSSNHVYHVVDAADFPMSLVYGLHRKLDVSAQRSINRRSQSVKYHQGRRTDLSFIITRSDLLAPTKERVDSMMPYLREVLRDSLGHGDDRFRLGNVRCVSAKRGWWTKQLKDEIWQRGHGGWLVGRVNVGKSSLFEAVYPKGRMELQKPTAEPSSSDENLNNSKIGLLPPAPTETQYPSMPAVSHLRGTTAAPIRHYFGNGKGELIDLPGLERGGFEEFVRPEQRKKLLLRRRIDPEQKNLKPGQSLTIADLVRITPKSGDLVFQAWPYVPLPYKVWGTAEAEAFVAQKQGSFERVTQRGLGDSFASAGTYRLQWDVTRQRGGPLTARSAIGLRTERIPFMILACDILLAGIGWVEMAVQVRKRQFGNSIQDIAPESFPRVEVFSPHGRNIGFRKPLIQSKN